MKFLEKTNLKQQKTDQCFQGQEVVARVVAIKRPGNFWCDGNFLKLDCGDYYTDL